MCTESYDIAHDLENYLCHIMPRLSVTIYSNEAASQWCNGKYNVVAVTQFTENDTKKLKSRFLAT